MIRVTDVCDSDHTSVHVILGRGFRDACSCLRPQQICDETRRNHCPLK